MEYRQLVRLIYGVLIFLLVYGCKTREPELRQVEVIEVIKEVAIERIDTRMPLTKAILRRISDGYEINEFQMISFGRITLEREYAEQNDGLGQGGRAEFEDVHTRDVIIIPDQTAGQVLKLDTAKDGEMILSVCFEENDKNTLDFSSGESDDDGYFYLKFSPTDASVLPQSGEEKGTLEYGEHRYKVKYGEGKRPYLLIKLSQSDSDKLNARTLSGRNIK
jgi:hypothetical protein